MVLRVTLLLAFAAGYVHADQLTIQEGADVSAVIQSAVEELEKGTIKLPAGTYVLQRPVVVDKNHIQVKGDDTTLRTHGAFPAFVMGFHRSPAEWIESEKYPSVAPYSDKFRRRYGYRVGKDYLAFPGSAFELGPNSGTSSATPPTYWHDTSQFVIDLWAGSEHAQWNEPHYLCGLSHTDVDRPDLWTLRIVNGKLEFAFLTSDRTSHLISAPLSVSGNTLKLSVQVDFQAATVDFWVNGEKAPTDYSFANQWKPGQKLTHSWKSQFQVGRGKAPATEFVLCGLSLRNGLFYDARQTTLARLDAGPTDESAIYQKAKAFARIEPTTTDSGHDRLVKYVSQDIGYYVGYGFFMHEKFTVADTIKGNAIRDVELQGIVPYGHNLTMGACYDLTLDGCTFTKGSVGVGDLQSPTSYVTTIRDCLFQHHGDCSIALGFGIHHVLNSKLKYYRRSALRSHRGNVTVRDCFATDSDRCVNAIRVSGTGQAVIENCIINFERHDNPFESYVHFEAAAYEGGNNFTVRNVTGFGAGPDASYVTLSSHGAAGTPSAAFPRGSLTLENAFNTFTSDRVKSLVSLDSEAFWQVNQLTPWNGAIPEIINVVDRAEVVEQPRDFKGIVGRWKASDLKEPIGETIARWGSLVASGSVVKAEVDGRPAVSLEGGYLTLPDYEPKNGLAVIAVLADRGQLALIDSHPGPNVSLQDFGNYTRVNHTPLKIIDHDAVATPKNKPIVYAASYSGGRLERWINGRLCGRTAMDVEMPKLLEGRIGRVGDVSSNAA
ncbi:MAG: right-handed parallel beta-helix repeat-containing protein, partial [Blastopirellula sp. JB062]